MGIQLSAVIEKNLCRKDNTKLSPLPYYSSSLEIQSVNILMSYKNTFSPTDH